MLKYVKRSNNIHVIHNSTCNYFVTLVTKLGNFSCLVVRVDKYTCTCLFTFEGIPEVALGKPRSHFAMARWQFRKLRRDMKLFSVLLLFIIVTLDYRTSAQEVENLEDGVSADKPTVMVAILVRNKGHVLPYFLHYLEQQDYPKDRMSIW